MRIVFSGVVLSDGGKGSPVALSTGGSKATETVPFLRAAHARIYDRGNRTNTIQWEHQREFATVSEAQAFMLLHAAAIPDGVADLTITLDDGTTLTLHDAVLAVPQGTRYQGVRTVHSYSATGRALSGAAVPTPIDPNEGRWILIAGIWADQNAWVDTKTWQDAA